MPRVSTLRPLVSRDSTFPLDCALNSVTRDGVLVYPLPNALKNYDNCANCASSRQACITSPPYSPTLCKKCWRQGRTKCPPHMSTTDAALWKKRDKEKRSKNKVKRTVGEADRSGTEAFMAQEIDTSLQSVPPDESTSNQPENVTKCEVGTSTSRPIAQHTFDPKISLEELSQQSQLPPDVQFQHNYHDFVPEYFFYESDLDCLPQARAPTYASPPPLWPDDQRFLTNLNLCL